MPITVYYQDEDDLKKKLAESIRVLYYLRKNTKVWSRVFGFESKKNKEIWEEKADLFLDGLMKEHRLNAKEKIKIEQQCQENEEESPKD